MARPKNTTSLMKDALNDRDIEELYWAFLTHCVQEIREDGKLSLFSGNHVISMLERLEKIQAEKKGDEPKYDTEEMKLWLNPAK